MGKNDSRKKSGTKKMLAEKDRQGRSAVGQMMNTGTRTMRSAKDYSRAENKKIPGDWD